MTSCLIGVGAHGQDIIQIWNDQDSAAVVWWPLVLLDELDPRYPHPSSAMAMPCYIGAYSPAQRWQIAQRNANFLPAPSLVHPTSKPGASCLLAGGVVVARNAVIDHDVQLGIHTHINYSASMTRCTIGNFSTISPGVTICGDVKIGDRVFIGAGAVIRNLVTIGDDAFIQMGAVVTRDVAPGSCYPYSNWRGQSD